MMRQTPPTIWERECERSLQRSRERRAQAHVSPWPRRWREWVAALAVAALLAAGGLLARNAQGAEYNLVSAAPAAGVHVTAPAHHHRRHGRR